MAYGQAGAAFDKGPPKANSLTNAISDLDPVVDRTLKYAEELREICDRIARPRPCPEKGSPILGEGPGPLIGRIHQHRSRLVEILNDIVLSLQTLNSVI